MANTKIIRADGVGYHNSSPKVVEQEITIKAKITLAEEDGTPVRPPRVEYQVIPSQNCGAHDALTHCLEAAKDAHSAIIQQSQQKDAQVRQMLEPQLRKAPMLQ